MPARLYGRSELRNARSFRVHGDNRAGWHVGDGRGRRPDVRWDAEIGGGITYSTARAAAIERQHQANGGFAVSADKIPFSASGIGPGDRACQCSGYDTGFTDVERSGPHYDLATWY